MREFEDITKQVAKQVLTELELPERTHTRCLEVLEDRRTIAVLNEKNMHGVISGAIYVSAILTESPIPQHKIANVLELSETTVRKYYVMLAKVLELKRKKD